MSAKQASRLVMTREKLDRAIAWREQGKSLGYISMRIDINPKTIDYHLRKLGVFPNGWVHRGDVRTKRSWVDKNGRAVRAFSPDEDAIADLTGRPWNGEAVKAENLADRQRGEFLKHGRRELAALMESPLSSHARIRCAEAGDYIPVMSGGWK